MIWVVGSTGMLGSEVCRQLKEKKINFTGTSSAIDITDIFALQNFIKEKKIDFIVNCSSYTAVDKAEEEHDKAEKLNSLGAKNLAIIATSIGAKIIHISTDYIFDGSQTSPITEDMPPSPIGVYAATKAKGEKNVTSSCVQSYILRTSWLYGWQGKNFVYTMIKLMNKFNEIKVVNDQRGSPTFCGDLAKVIILFIQKNGEIPYGIYNYSGDADISWWDFAVEINHQATKIGLIKNQTCKINPCTTEEYPTPAKRPHYSVLCKDKIQKTLGIILPDWKESLTTFLKSDFFDKEKLI
ncbi:dTDP-4-dehydrorhamnose reductase [Treponema pectinovorum]|uniref:dTDP-4-dehydrorhamnose reductase n=1 Tax=Treponema pectinovorum TaxID=164 RepID=UPI0011C8C465|nr:dTDP-4-dehydrorhamnose reductase [Treponema pectinovorum]